ncbi:MAG: DUF1566 domain-containing protein, partial [Magnetococcales bacterium]|nr:DUF1566 domain-containing protein [Magnetococcales bacterium]
MMGMTMRGAKVKLDLRQGGFSLTEVMVAIVLSTLLVVGVVNLLVSARNEFNNLTLKQKAILLLSSEMERLQTYYRREFMYYKNNDHADGGSLFGRWIYRKTPQGTVCPVGDSECLVARKTTDASVTQADLDGKILFMDYDAAANSYIETNVLWLDRARNVTAKFSWILNDTKPTTGNSCCQMVTATIEFPFRFKEGVTPVEQSFGSIQAINDRMIVCGKAPYPTSVAKTGAVRNYYGNDDGMLQKGAPPPVSRFVNNYNGTITDVSTGLMWTSNASLLGSVADPLGTYLRRVDRLNSGQSTVGSTSYRDWRVANIRELLSLINYGYTNKAVISTPSGSGFSGIGGSYVSSSIMYGYPDNSFRYILGVNKSNDPDFVFQASKCSSSIGWLVRNEPVVDSCSIPSPVIKTGQTAYSIYGIFIPWQCSQDANYILSHPLVDGNSKKGVYWPLPRFVNNNNGTISDSVTGLMWSLDFNLGNDCDGPNRGNVSYNSAIDSVALCNDRRYGGYNDWRLPNVKELESLSNYSSGGSIVGPFLGVATQLSSTRS